jgi:hypothetical protein
MRKTHDHGAAWMAGGLKQGAVVGSFHGGDTRGVQTAAPGRLVDQALIAKPSAYPAGFLPSHTVPSINLELRMSDSGSGVPVCVAACL